MDSRIHGLDEDKTYLSAMPLLIKVDSIYNDKNLDIVEISFTNTSKISEEDKNEDSKAIKLYAYKNREMIIDLSIYIKQLVKAIDGRDEASTNKDIPNTLNHFTLEFTLTYGEEKVKQTKNYHFLNAGYLTDKTNVEAPEELTVASPFYLDDNSPIGLGTSYNAIEDNQIVSRKRIKENTDQKYYIHSGLEYPLWLKFINRYGGYSYLAFEEVQEKIDVSSKEQINTFNNYEKRLVYGNYKPHKVTKSFTATTELKSIFKDLLEDLICSSYVEDIKTGRQLILAENNFVFSSSPTIDFTLNYSYLSHY